jgi:hypothetical protein
MLHKIYDYNRIDPFIPFSLGKEYFNIGDIRQALHFFSVVYRDYQPYLPNFYHYAKVLLEANSFDAAARVIGEGITLATKRGDDRARQELEELRQLA